MKYPGLHFTPPDDTVDPEAMEGEGLVQWKKIGDKYTIITFEGKSLEDAEEGEESEDADMMAQIGMMYPNP